MINLNFSLIFPKSREISKEYKDLFIKLFEKDPKKRLTIELVN